MPKIIVVLRVLKFVKIILNSEISEIRSTVFFEYFTTVHEPACVSSSANQLKIQIHQQNSDPTDTTFTILCTCGVFRWRFVCFVPTLATLLSVSVALVVSEIVSPQDFLSLFFWTPYHQKITMDNVVTLKW